MFFGGSHRQSLPSARANKPSPVRLAAPIALAAPAVPALREDERTLARRDLRHRDAVGLSGLMNDYFALADELEELPAAVDGPPVSKRAA